jgi:CRISPR-associated protein Cas2
MLILLSYDVPDDRRRTRLAHALKDFGERVRYSVFECRLTPKQLDRLRERVRPPIAPEEDSLRIYVLPDVYLLSQLAGQESCQPRKRLFGGRLSEWR